MRSLNPLSGLEHPKYIPKIAQWGIKIWIPIITKVHTVGIIIQSKNAPTGAYPNYPFAYTHTSCAPCASITYIIFLPNRKIHQEVIIPIIGIHMHSLIRFTSLYAHLKYPQQLHNAYTSCILPCMAFPPKVEHRIKIEHKYKDLRLFVSILDIPHFPNKVTSLRTLMELFPGQSFLSTSWLIVILLAFSLLPLLPKQRLP